MSVIHNFDFITKLTNQVQISVFNVQKEYPEIQDITAVEVDIHWNLGLDVGSYDILSEFVRNIKSKNLVYSVGIDLLKNSFSFENKYLIKFRNSIMNSLNKNTSAKKIFYNIANKGLRL